MERVICKLDIGSNVKGYNNENSDRDEMFFVKSSTASYIRHFAGIENVLQNRHLVNDSVRSDLLTGLVGVYKGNYPHLWIHGNEETLKDEPELLAFVLLLGNARLKLVLDHLVRFGKRMRDPATKRVTQVNVKSMLQMLFNLSLVNYCLTHGSRPGTTAQLGMSHHLPDKYRTMFENLMDVRCEQQTSPEKKRVQNTTKDDILWSYVDELHKFREELRKKVDCMPDHGEQLHLLKNIVDYFLFDTPLPNSLHNT